MNSGLLLTVLSFARTFCCDWSGVRRRERISVELCFFILYTRNVTFVVYKQVQHDARLSGETENVYHYLHIQTITSPSPKREPKAALSHKLHWMKVAGSNRSTQHFYLPKWWVNSSKIAMPKNNKQKFYTPPRPSTRQDTGGINTG